MITGIKILTFWLSLFFTVGGICVYKRKKRSGKSGKKFLIWGIIIGIFLFHVCRVFSSYEMHADAETAYNLIHSGNVDKVYVDGTWDNNFSKTEDLYSYEKVQVINNNVYLTSFQ